MKKIPKVGVRVCIKKDGTVLLGKRINTLGEETWCFPGGHLEFNESWEDCAHREILEETGIIVKNIHFTHVTNDFFPIKEEHYVNIFMTADYDSGKVKIMEPEKCEQWDWFEWDSLPQPLFTPTENYYRNGENPFKK